MEESAAAAESLKLQAQQLVQIVAVFRLDSSDSKDVTAALPALVTVLKEVERRGLDRAKNVQRPKFGSKARADSIVLATETTVRKTGTDDEWTSF